MALTMATLARVEGIGGNDERGKPLLHDVVRLLIRQGNFIYLIGPLVALGFMAMRSQEQPEGARSAAQIYRVMTTWTEKLGGTSHWNEGPLQQAIEQLTVMLGADTFAQAFEAGKQMTPADLVQLADQITAPALQSPLSNLPHTTPVHEHLSARVVEVLVAQGTEAGGHTGHNGTLPIMAAVLDVAGDIPVLASGGIADGRGLAAVLILGAEGTWMGTRFYASKEAGAENWEKERMVQAGTDDTVFTNVYDLALGFPFPPTVGDRVLRNDFTAEWHGRYDEVIALDKELLSQVIAAMKEGNARIAAVRAGNAVGLIHEIEAAGDIVRKVVAEAEHILRERPGQLLRY